MKPLIIVLGLVIAFSSCQTGTNKKNKSALKSKINEKYKLEAIWSTDTVFKTPESVLYDYARDVIYVSNVNQNPWQKDGNGFISKIDMQGNVIDLEWVKGMDGPKGMGLVDSMLYVANLDEVIEINVNTGLITNRIIFKNEDGLNDIAIGDMGEVYISSSSNSIVYKLIGGEYKILTQGEDERYNGLHYETDRLLILTSKGHQLKSFDHASGKVNVLASNLGHADGIVALESGGYLTSDWNGEIFFISDTYEVMSLLDTKEQEINTADIEFVQKDNMLLIPTFFDNRVLAYHLIKE